jgi:DNA topoisomerase-1
MSKHLVIVESPTKARTIQPFLGNDYHVLASMGHVRDLPSSTMAVDTEGDFTPVYEVSDGKKKVITELKKALKAAETLWIATDEDREGEAIGWHLLEVLKPKKEVPVKRIVFHEITKPAILAAIEHPVDINQNLCKAQEARRVLDRLVGYTLSPLLWKKVARGLSAGRVQSVAVKIIVDRELAIRAFKPEEYWSLIALLNTDNKEGIEATLKKRDGKWMKFWKILKMLPTPWLMLKKKR